MRLIRLAVTVLGSAAVLLTAGEGYAEPGGVARNEEDRARARELMREGNELYGNGKPSEAFVKYLEAWRTAQAFDIACNLGGTASELSMNRDAAEYLDYCLRHYAASSRPEAVASEKRARAAFEVVKSKVATVHVRVTPPGAEVFVDGARVGHAPLEAPVYLEAGPHRIEARSAGFETVTTEIDAKRGETFETTIELKLLAGAAGAENPASSGDQGAAGTPPDAAPGRPKNYVPAIVSASIGGVALASGIVFLVVRSGKQSDASDKLATLEGTNPCGAESPSTNRAACSEVADLSDQAATFGTLSLVGFGAAAGAGVATFLLWPKGGGGTSRELRPAVTASTDGFYASVRGAF